ncbi:MAG: hypothetical protein ACLTW9_00670 [Enterocloster sp.]
MAIHAHVYAACHHTESFRATVTIGHKMLNPNDARYYPGVIGGKTGLYGPSRKLPGDSGGESDGVRLIAVIMKSKSTHYTDTRVALSADWRIWSW